ncbi:protein halfway-like [Teleopsis dalmanni]|uniref:protein halfway-like n=1 Tax=Teleopsis dalmanni TaxID=139649 RepID=UPI0018CCA860|nr:protein halfway-like [Teleopsis dalmanni]
MCLNKSFSSVFIFGITICLLGVTITRSEENSLTATNQQQYENVNTSSKNPSINENETPDSLKNCYYAEESLCLIKPQHDNQTESSCQCAAHPTIENFSYCCNVTHMVNITSCTHISTWTKLHIRNISLPELNLGNSIYQTLISLAITDGNITRATNSFSRASKIRCLNISNNHLLDIEDRALGLVSNLTYLDIANNNLSRIPKWNQSRNITVNVSGNKHMLCKTLKDAIFHDSFKFVNPETSYCVQNYTFNWFNGTDYVSIQQLQTLKRLKTECPVIPGRGNCTCTIDKMLASGDQSKPSAKLFCRVDCSSLGLTELPAKLPENTFSLDISNNNISSIESLGRIPSYQNIVMLYADNNQISSMNDLEGTEFLNHFQRLSLRNNALKKLPEYLLTNVLIDTGLGRKINLGGNKLECDCNSAKVLKLWLLERSRDIPDYNDILCRNMAHRVMELQEEKMCQSPHDWTDYIYYLIAAEALLLIALITKVSYDYWVFKTAGYLPWPASKMPKLPCDWLCES